MRHGKVGQHLFVWRTDFLLDSKSIRKLILLARDSLKDQYKAKASPQIQALFDQLTKLYDPILTKA
jgi:hypothetical protein